MTAGEKGKKDGREWRVSEGTQIQEGERRTRTGYPRQELLKLKNEPADKTMMEKAADKKAEGGK